MNYLTPRNGKTDDIMSPLLSLRRAAKYVGLGLSTFYEKMKKGEVDKVTFDGRTFTTIRSLDAYISRNTQPAKIEAKTEPPPREERPLKRRLVPGKQRRRKRAEGEGPRRDRAKERTAVVVTQRQAGSEVRTGDAAPGAAGSSRWPRARTRT